MIWTALILLAVLVVSLWLFKDFKKENPDDPINQAKKMYFPAQKNNDDR